MNLINIRYIHAAGILSACLGDFHFSRISDLIVINTFHKMCHKTLFIKTGKNVNVSVK